MKSKTSKRIALIIGSIFVGGLILIAVPFIAGMQPGDSLLSVVVRISSGLGEASVVAAIIGFAFERLLSEERIREIEEIFKLHRHLERFGFKATYATRQEVFDEILGRQLSRVKRELKIMGICVSLFKEAGRAKSSPKRERKDSIIEALAGMVHDGVTVQVLLLKRMPSSGGLQPGVIPQVDLMYFRERDEDKPEEFQHGRRMKGIANRSVADWIDVLLSVAGRLEHVPNHDHRREVLHRLQIREYVALPALSLYVLDEDMYVTPYLFKRHCSDVPAFRVGGKDSPLFTEYYAHFTQTWDDDRTISIFPEKFIERLVEEPALTIKEFADRQGTIQAAFKRDLENWPTLTELPEFYSASEQAMYDVVGERSRHAHVGGGQRSLF